MRTRSVFAFLILVFVLVASPCSAASTAKNAPRAAIVLASFGSTVQTARDAEAAFVEATRKRYPQIRVELANTARIVMKKNKEQGVAIPSLFRVLADLADEGYDTIAVQSLQLIPGAEFDGVAAVASAQAGLPKGIKKISIGNALLASNEDCQKVAAALLASLPKERKTNEPVIFVGHGTHHGVGGMVYPALQWRLAQLDSRVFVSTIEGVPSRDETLQTLGAPGNKNAAVWVAPLLTLAGDHAVNDLYGADDDSWKSVLTQKGWQVKQSFTPLLNVPGVRDVFFAHLDDALKEIQ